MRIFITGPLGYVGRPIAEVFRDAGHQVLGLVRNEAQANLLMQMEIEPLVGDLSDFKSYESALEQAEVIIHCAFDSSTSALSIESRFIDKVLELSDNIPGCTKAFIYTSGVWVIGNTGDYFADESSVLKPLNVVKWRKEAEEKILKSSTNSFRTVIIRPGCVYGSAGGLTSLWFSSILRGAIEIVGEGNNFWSMIHQRDLARAYLLVVEKEMNNIVFNIVDNSHYTVYEMAATILEAAGVPGKVEIIPEHAAEQKYGEMTEGLLANQHISNERACRLLGWRPMHRSFVDNAYIYYRAWKAAQVNQT